MFDTHTRNNWKIWIFASAQKYQGQLLLILTRLIFSQHYHLFKNIKKIFRFVHPMCLNKLRMILYIIRFDLSLRFTHKFSERILMLLFLYSSTFSSFFHFSSIIFLFQASFCTFDLGWYLCFMFFFLSFFMKDFSSWIDQKR